MMERFLYFLIGFVTKTEFSNNQTKIGHHYQHLAFFTVQPTFDSNSQWLQQNRGETLFGGLGTWLNSCCRLCQHHTTLVTNTPHHNLPTYLALPAV